MYIEIPKDDKDFASFIRGRNSDPETEDQRLWKEEEAVGAANQKGNFKIRELMHNSPSRCCFSREIFILP